MSNTFKTLVDTAVTANNGEYYRTALFNSIEEAVVAELDRRVEEAIEAAVADGYDEAIVRQYCIGAGLADGPEPEAAPEPEEDLTTIEGLAAAYRSLKAQVVEFFSHV